MVKTTSESSFLLENLQPSTSDKALSRERRHDV
jgi:hypothetical protein